MVAGDRPCAAQVRDALRVRRAYDAERQQTVDTGRRFLFAALRSTGQLASFRINPGTGALAHADHLPLCRHAEIYALK